MGIHNSIDDIKRSFVQICSSNGGKAYEYENMLYCELPKHFVEFDPNNFKIRIHELSAKEYKLSNKDELIKIFTQLK